MSNSRLPAKSDPASYTVAVVQRALDRYENIGAEETIAYYNTPESVDGAWYVFIIDDNDVIVSHGTNPSPVGLNMTGPIGVDLNGHRYGTEMLAVPEEGAWVDYMFFNPATDRGELKHSWVVRRDNLLIGSGWYESPG